MLYMRPVHSPCNYPVYQHNLNEILQALINDIMQLHNITLKDSKFEFD